MIRNASVSCKVFTGSDRLDYVDPVWDMYEKTYRSIGLGVKSPLGLLDEAPTWEVCLDGDDVPRAFNFYKNTEFGMKSVLAGSDGSPDGKQLSVNGIRTKFKRPGFYGEVSHKVLDIALAAGAPVVCASYVGKILGKSVDPQPDGVSYRRTITGVGPVVKVLIGMPRGIPTTNWESPRCPVNSVLAGSIDLVDDDVMDVLAHFSCIRCD
jgi:hypothetical protein